MNRRKFLKIFGVAMTSAGTSGCVATFNSKETKFEPNPIPQEKKHFEKPLVKNNQSKIEHCSIWYDTENNIYKIYNGEKWVEVDADIYAIQIKG